ncbi:peptidoglycan DD-metalloendopeptidase family protein [Fusibacter paucivorans]|uniref:Peptidoglycan DD-metalloendopeptidase family protein n=1 Tax=Fusibacter paucivorans TaxID=76009 RepID=A0ABS5PPV0_9FIRM|nr:M23 family metallopeptidase [Fusibacter paucivorans]MBS7527200.1 peptidoglycan DD-metalloendopeptidase family protein [Fusibacter paucivorans]
MGRKNRSTQNKVYKRHAQKVYVKGDAKSSRWDKTTDVFARVIAMLFYPFYLLYTKISGHQKMSKNSNVSSKASTKLSVSTLIEKLKMRLRTLDFSALKALDREKIKAITSKYASFLNHHKVVVSGVIGVMVVALIGVQALSSFNAVDVTSGEMSEAHMVSVTEAKTSDAALEPLEALPTLPDISFAAVRAYEIVVNDTVLAKFKSESECDNVLDQLVSMYTTVGEEETSEILDWYYSEDVKILHGFVPLTDFEGYDDVEAMLAYIVKGTKEERTHIVQKGENYWVIAAYYGIQPSDLEAANPNVKPEALQIGQEISLVVPKPMISVCTVERAEYIDNIPFEVTYEDTSSLYRDETKVKVKGIEGEREVVANVTKQNGREIGRTVLEETVLSEPTTKVVYKGTKEPPPRMGTGTLKRPASRGSVTSEFGWRWGARHEGIDIGLPVGSDVKAADGGVVTFAGYSSSYGYYVMIDHGGNIKTVYAHCSKLLVSKNDKVYQGQVIARSGNTGRSTGPHLHFEVRVNGTPVNPRNYVSF